MNKRYFLFIAMVVTMMSCRKTEFGNVENPAYLRVFNCLDFNITLDNKDAPQPYLTMLIDPVLDADGIPESAAIIGDFLDKRGEWARPYPDAVNTTTWQKEYPGTLKVMAGPILNGYDLSSWAQVPSGKHRIIFRTRPYNTTPFFSLEKNLRGVSLIDTTMDLQTREVYTMHVLERDYLTRKTGLYLRNENFVKQPFSDSMVYVNFYNLSSEGFFKYASQKIDHNAVPNRKIRDTMSVFYSITRMKGLQFEPIPGFNGLPMGPVIRSQQSHVNPYYNFPLFPDTSASRVFTGNIGQLFRFYGQGLTPETAVNSSYLPQGSYSALGVGDFGYGSGNQYVPFRIQADLRTGLIVSVHSGAINPRSFATVNTIEYINEKMYVTTIQRKYAPPVY